MRRRNSYSRARSTKTRIETPVCLYGQHMEFIREQDPLKQGLKQPLSTGLFPISIIREQDPLKQGLKLKYISKRC